MTKPITSLHDAAKRLQSIKAEVERILEESEFLEVVHHQRIIDAGAPVDSYLDEATEKAIESETGWRAYAEVAEELISALGVVGLDASRAMRAAWESSR